MKTISRVSDGLVAGDIAERNVLEVSVCFLQWVVVDGGRAAGGCEGRGWAERIVCVSERVWDQAALGGRRDLGPRHRMWRVLNKIIALRKGRVLLEY